MMTTTPNPTAEQIVSEALGPYGLIGRARDLAARNAVEQLRTHGLLSEGTDPSRQEIPLVCLGFESGSTFAVTGENAGHWVEGSPTHVSIAEGTRTALTATGVAPQEPSQTETKSGNNFVSLDPEKVAEVIEQMRDRARKERDVTKESLGQFIARALCEAYTEGKLT